MNQTKKHICNDKECYHTINDLKESIYGPKQNI